MDIFPQLKLLGLNHSEITVYLFLLENGISTPPNVSRGTNIARTNCYNILEELKNKGLVEEQAQGKRKAYIASDPESLMRSLEQKKEVVQRILPDLRGLYTSQKNKPKIEYYDGAVQIKEIYFDSLNANEVYAMGSSNKLLERMPEFYAWYFGEIKTREISWSECSLQKFITREDQKLNEIIYQLYKSSILADRGMDFPTNIIIWDDKIALITLEDRMFGTVLQNKLLSTTFKIIFEILRSVA